VQNISPRLIDFLEIASYVFTADCSTQRGQWTDDKREEPWGRDLAFLIAVREPEFWASPTVMGLLQDVLRFLSNDSYSFQFVPLEADRNDQTPYFNFDDQARLRQVVCAVARTSILPELVCGL
jgi:hypothetical protein